MLSNSFSVTIPSLKCFSSVIFIFVILDAQWKSSFSPISLLPVAMLIPLVIVGDGKMVVRITGAHPSHSHSLSVSISVSVCLSVHNEKKKQNTQQQQALLLYFTMPSLLNR